MRCYLFTKFAYHNLAQINIMTTAEKAGLGAVELALLEYVLNFHKSQTNDQRHAYLALLCHADLLSKGARLINDDLKQNMSVLPSNWAESDPIRLLYRICDKIVCFISGLRCICKIILQLFDTIILHNRFSSQFFKLIITFLLMSRTILIQHFLIWS